MKEKCKFCGKTIPEGNQVCIICGRGKPKEMTNKEALNTLDETVIGNLELKIILTKAIEKQIPTKPILKIFEDIDEETNKKFYPNFYLCDVCGGLIGAKHNKYCSECGQALDWSDTE